MRAAFLLALAASIVGFSGCGAINGPGCGNSMGGYCDDGSCGSCDVGGFFGSVLGRRSMGQPMNMGQQVSPGCGTDQTFSDVDCGPMCGAYLSDQQAADSGCGCDQCQVGPSYVAGRVGSWFGQGENGFQQGMVRGRIAGAMQREHVVGQGQGLLGPCRGLGASVGCAGCVECGSGNAIGMNHSASNDPSNGLGKGGYDGCRDGNCGPGGLAQKLLSIPFRGNGSPHPYGGELPHTASAAAGGAGAGAGGSAAPTYNYPYYTTRGPRDFLMMNPPSIGR